MVFRESKKCPLCGEEIEEVHADRVGDFVGDTFLCYKAHACKAIDENGNYTRLITNEELLRIMVGFGALIEIAVSDKSLSDRAKKFLTDYDIIKKVIP